jgi:hypothetical protein
MVKNFFSWLDKKINEDTTFSFLLVLLIAATFGFSAVILFVLFICLLWYVPHFLLFLFVLSWLYVIKEYRKK